MNCFSHPEIDERLSHAEQVEQIKTWKRNNVAAWAARTRALLDAETKPPASGQATRAIDDQTATASHPTTERLA